MTGVERRFERKVFSVYSDKCLIDLAVDPRNLRIGRVLNVLKDVLKPELAESIEIGEDSRIYARGKKLDIGHEDLGCGVVREADNEYLAYVDRLDINPELIR